MTKFRVTIHGIKLEKKEGARTLRGVLKKKWS